MCLTGIKDHKKPTQFITNNTNDKNKKKTNSNNKNQVSNFCETNRYVFWTKKVAIEIKEFKITESSKVTSNSCPFKSKKHMFGSHSNCLWSYE